MYRGDVLLGSTLVFGFTTVNTSGVPTSLLGTPAVAAYVDGSDTEITAGITLTVDQDSRTGLNRISAVLSGANGFAAATNVRFVITAGTVSGLSVVGYQVAEVSIQNRAIAVDADGAASANLTKILGTLLTETAGLLAAGFKKFFNVATPTGTVNSLPDAVPGAAGALLRAGSNAATTVDITGSLSGSVGSVGAGGISAASIADGALTAAKFAAGAFDAVWSVASRVLTAFAGFTINSEVTAIKAKTDNLPSDPADQSVIIAATDAILAAVDTRLAAAAYTAPPSAATVAAAVRGIVVESQGSVTLQQAMSIVLAALAGVTDDDGATMKTSDGVATRVAGTVVGTERTAITLTPSA